MSRSWLASSLVRRAVRLARGVRGALVLGVLWAVSWGLAAVALSPSLWPILPVATPRSLGDALSVAGVFGAMMGWFGLLTGMIFSVVLAVAARGRAIHQLTPRRMAAWGVVSSVLFTGPPTIYMLAARPHGWRADDALFIGGSLLLSAGCAVASLVMARRAPEWRSGAWELDAGGDAVRVFMPANATLRSGRHAVVVPASHAPERVPIP